VLWGVIVVAVCDGRVDPGHTWPYMCCDARGLKVGAPEEAMGCVFRDCGCCRAVVGVSAGSWRSWLCCCHLKAWPQASWQLFVCLGCDSSYTHLQFWLFCDVRERGQGWNPGVCVCGLAIGLWCREPGACHSERG
jgi:hypothetical protein